MSRGSLYIVHVSLAHLGLLTTALPQSSSCGTMSSTPGTPQKQGRGYVPSGQQYILTSVVLHTWPAEQQLRFTQFMRVSQAAGTSSGQTSLPMLPCGYPPLNEVWRARWW
ncbi:hypothetical protein B0T16DRAFT_417572 [Cercophora newfieldiana]|uniref:Uncharacterized protein n=1 Tax=Cercophora newfieldiana TaxID=92897 RepID=A0AA39Y1N6_9PEZI|nr:hypothetical protein B0T16DRAFT_417572 [Cercophora newfieldiana]